MAKVTYRPVREHAAPDHTSQYGYDFEAGQPVEVTNAAHVAKFSGHPSFEVEHIDDPAPSGLQAVHRGRGVYGIVDGDRVLDQMGQLSKDEAEAFNAMSEADKAEYVSKAD